MPTIHATTVDVEGMGILIEGEAGSGKTSLGFAIVEKARAEGRAACFVSDDRTIVIADERGELEASAPPAIAGMAELRGFGIVRVEHVPCTRLVLALRLVADDQIERMPEPAWRDFAHGRLPLALVPARHESASVRIAFAFLARLREMRAEGGAD